MSFLGNIVSGVTKAVTDPGALVSDAAKAVLPKNMAAVGDILGGIADIESGHPLQALSHLTDALKDLPQLMQALSSGPGGSSAAQPAGTAGAEPSPPPTQSSTTSPSGSTAAATTPSTTTTTTGATPGSTTGSSAASTASTPPPPGTTPSQTGTATRPASAPPITPLDIFRNSTGPSVQTSGTPGNRTITINEGASDGNRTITIQEKAGQPPNITVTPKPAPGMGPAVTVARGTNGQQTITVNDSRLGGGKSITYQEYPGQPPTLSTTGFPAPWQSLIAALAAKLPSPGVGTTSGPPGSGVVAAAASTSASSSAATASPSTASTTASATAATTSSTSSSSTAASASTPAAAGTSSSAAAPTDLASLMALSPDQFMQAVTSGKIPDSVANSQSAMMQVQSRMNQITQMNQLVTGMMAAMHQMEMSIIQNIRC
jgi:hypothetical protein